MTHSSSVASTGELVRERDRVVGRLRTLALEAIPYDDVLAAAQRLEDLAAQARRDTARPVPALAPYAAADQVTVLVGELLAAARRLGEPGGAALAGAATSVLIDLRRSLAAT
jgi:hypothetical protein